MKDLRIKISGTSGQGIISSGDILCYSVARKGYYVTTYRAFPSEIRGDGKCYYSLRISEYKALTVSPQTDILITLDTDTISEGIKTLVPGSVILYDSDVIKDAPEVSDDIVTYALPITTIATSVSTAQARNMVALGIVSELVKNLNLQEQIVKDIERRYKSKPQEVKDSNIKAFKAGIEYAKTKINRTDKFLSAQMATSGPKLIMSGNEAIGLAAIVSGCRFFAGYPITPATEIMEWLAKELPKFGGKMLQCEDEIAAINYALGASFAGIKSMTATSGPGFSLMQEAIGLASMAELPVVIADIQRCGPSTGVPTKTEQSDLGAALYGTHGDCPKIVLAPMNVVDCFYQTINAFNFAEEYQVPVILLSDASLGPRRECVDLIDLDKIVIKNRLKANLSADKPYIRYENTQNGISPVSFPGEKYGAYVATGLEHTEENAPTPNPEIHKKMTEKRFRKLNTAAHEFSKAHSFGDKDAKIGIISWGATCGAVLEMIKMAQANGHKVEALYPRTLYPLPTEWITNFIKDKDVIIVIENNYNAQFKSTIVERCLQFNKGIQMIELLKYDGTPFTPEEIYKKFEEVEDNYKTTLRLSSNRDTHF